MAYITTGKSQYVLTIPFGVSQNVLPGSSIPARFAGATTDGPPTINGKYNVGDFVIDTSGKIHICHTAGSASSPGLWHTISASGALSANDFGKLQATTTDGTTIVDMTKDGLAKSSANSIVIPVNTAVMANISIMANASGAYAAMWKFSGLFRRQTSLGSATLVGISQNEVVADPYFNSSYIDIDTESTFGSISLKVKGPDTRNITWSSTFQLIGLS
jgi:hypothetical protein